jgi:hypothetical protein
MNEYEVDDALSEFGGHPILGPAAMTLSNMRDWVNRNSDGWAYWQAPQKAGAKLMQLLHDARVSRIRYDLDETEPTETDYKAALRPVKAFRTRRQATFRIVEVGEPLDPYEDEKARITLAQAALNLASRHLTNDDVEAAREAMAVARDTLTAGATTVSVSSSQ